MVTGKPGVGKSALLGILVAAAHPALRAATAQFWSNLDRAPYLQSDGFCAVHARGRTLTEITKGIARQLGLAETGQVDRVIRDLAERGAAPPLIVIDAVDEANDPEAVAKVLLHRLVTTSRADGATSICRLLIGSRPEPWLVSLIEAGGSGAEIDLGKTNRGELRADLLQYLERMLIVDGPYATSDKGAVRTELVNAIADALSGEDMLGGTPDCGEFLVAGMYAQRLREHPPATDAQQARKLGAAVPRTLSEVLELDLAQRASPWLRPLLVSIAHARGDGMPELLIRQVMRAIQGGPDESAGPSNAELDEALRAGEFYLRRAVDPGGRTLYRLFHQGLADSLREDPVGSGAVRASGEHGVVEKAGSS